MSCIDPTLDGHVVFYSDLPENSQAPLSYVQIDRLTTSQEDFGIPILDLCHVLWLVDNNRLMAFCR